jgi:hypothetical protein
MAGICKDSRIGGASRSYLSGSADVSDAELEGADTLGVPEQAESPRQADRRVRVFKQCFVIVIIGQL